jgi:hypothetical protein
MPTETDKEQNKIKPEDNLRPSQKELKIVYSLYEKYIKWASIINSPLPQFRGLDLESYLKASRQLFWGESSIKSILMEDVFKAEFDLFLPEIRNNVLDIVSNLSQLRIKPVFGLTEKKLEAMYQSKILEAIYANWRNVSKDKIEKFWDYLYVIINGTLIKHVYWEGFEKELTYFVPKREKLIQKRQKIFQGEVKSERIPLENVFIPKIWEPDIRKQHEILIVERMKYDEFKEKFSNYEKSKYVFPGNLIHRESLYFKLLPAVTTADMVEVVRYYNDLRDEFVLIANGVWLNPLNEEEEIFPIPFNHKKLPFAKTIFEPIDDRFFYGLSLPMKLKTPQEIYNVMTQLLIIREMKEISPPILTSDFEKPNLTFGPSTIIPVGDVNAYRELNIQPASGSFFTALNVIKSNLQPTSPPVVIGSRQPRSATEKIIEQYRRNMFLNNYVNMIWDLLYQEIELVLKTALQFYPLKKHKQILPTGIVKEIYRLISVENTTLPQGGLGDLEVRVVEKPSFWQELALEVATRQKFSRKLLDVIEIKPEELQKLDFVITNIQLEQENPPIIEQALFKEKIAFIFQAFGPMISPEKAILRTMEILRENPSDWIRDDILSRIIQLEREEGQPLNTPNLMSLPITQNLIQSIRGMEFGSKARTETPQMTEFGSQENIPLEEMM